MSMTSGLTLEEISELQYEVDQLKRELNFEKHCRTACQEIRKWPIWKQLSLGIEPVIIPPVLERLLNEKKQLADEIDRLEAILEKKIANSKNETIKYELRALIDIPVNTGLKIPCYCDVTLSDDSSHKAKIVAASLYTTEESGDDSNSSG